MGFLTVHASCIHASINVTLHMDTWTFLALEFFAFAQSGLSDLCTRGVSSEMVSSNLP